MRGEKIQPIWYSNRRKKMGVLNFKFRKNQFVRKNVCKLIGQKPLGANDFQKLTDGYWRPVERPLLLVEFDKLPRPLRDLCSSVKRWVPKRKAPPFRPEAVKLVSIFPFVRRRRYFARPWPPVYLSYYHYRKFSLKQPTVISPIRPWLVPEFS